MQNGCGMQLGKLFNKAKSIIKEDACMKFYKTKLLYVETDPSGVGLRVGLLKTSEHISCPGDEAPDNNMLRPIIYASKRLSAANTEALSILYGLEKFHHYCFARELSIITDQKLLVEILKKGVATLSQEITMHTTQKLPIQNKNNIKTWARSVHSRLAIKTKS